MSRNESQILKGVAILFMLFWHLFNRIGNVDLCNTYLDVGNIPLVHFLCQATNPVSFFLILGGYGLYVVNEKGDKHRWSRLIKLLLHYWIVLTIFVYLGFNLNPERYPGDVWKIVENYSTLNTTYNGECWFLFPYLLLSVSAPFLFNKLKNVKAWIILLITYVISFITSYLISRHWEDLFADHFLFYDFFLYFHLLFSFLLGAMAAREKWLEKLSWISGKGKYLWGVLIILFLLRCVFTVSVLGGLYAFSFVVLFLKAPRYGWVNSVLANLGKYSMDMWFIHSWFCYYLFKDFIYGFRYPVVIFLVLIVISYVCARVLNFVIDGLVRIKCFVLHDNKGD